MKLILFFLFFPLCCKAGSAEEAFKKASEALSKTEPAKKFLKRAEILAYKVIPVSRETAAAIGTTALIFAEGGITTKPLKNMKIDFMSGKFRPDFAYKFNSGEVTGNLKMDWEW